jgi:prepilin-type processing-associated H-X9-DG protein
MYDKIGISRGESLDESLVRSLDRSWLEQPHDSFQCPSEAASGANPDRPFALDSGAPVELTRSNYIGVYGNVWSDTSDGVFGRNSWITPAQVTNGLSNVLLLGERHAGRYPGIGSVSLGRSKASTCDAAIAWGALVGVRPPRESDVLGVSSAGINSVRQTLKGPLATDCESGFSSRHSGGAQFALADGKVTLIADRIDGDVLRGLAARCGRQPVIIP